MEQEAITPLSPPLEPPDHLIYAKPNGPFSIVYQKMVNKCHGLQMLD